MAWFAYLHPVVYDPATPPEHVLALSWSLCLAAGADDAAGALHSRPGLSLLRRSTCFLRDIYHVMGASTLRVMDVPDADLLPGEGLEAGMTWVLEYNPVYWPVDGYRNAAVRDLAQAPDRRASAPIAARLRARLSLLHAAKPALPSNCSDGCAQKTGSGSKRDPGPGH
ncbi:MAG: hypothetical protein IPJ19_19030 [Planctomycetes bacterium]|nr:hypothetical protein [Planctomycetota bacterium]